MVFTSDQSTSAVELPLGPFFNGWDPDSRLVASLGSLEGEVALMLADPDTPEVSELGRADRLFVSWERGGRRAAMNAGGVLRVTDTAGLRSSSDD